MKQLSHLQLLQKKSGISERLLAKKTGMSRTSVRAVLSSEKNVSMVSIKKVSEALNVEPLLSFIAKDEIQSDDCIPVISLLIKQDNKWEIHLFNFVDAFRRELDSRLIELPPIRSLPLKYKALLASTVSQLCFENKLPTPSWARKSYYLQDPWFVSGIENLKAMAIQHSPVYFRRNNIFVLDNFLSRA